MFKDYIGYEASNPNGGPPKVTLGTVAGMEPFQLDSFMRENKERSDYNIIDLREVHDLTKDNGSDIQIPGSKHLPLVESATETTNSQILEARDLAPSTTPASQAKTKVLWDYLKNREPILSTLNKKYVFFHCQQSTNRTSAVASGYYEFVVKPMSEPKPTVIIIEGGFSNWVAQNGTSELCLVVNFFPDANAAV